MKIFFLKNSWKLKECLKITLGTRERSKDNWKREGETDTERRGDRQTHKVRQKEGEN